LGNREKSKTHLFVGGEGNRRGRTTAPVFPDNGGKVKKKDHKERFTTGKSKKGRIPNNSGIGVNLSFLWEGGDPLMERRQKNIPIGEATLAKRGDLPL